MSSYTYDDLKVDSDASASLQKQKGSFSDLSFDYGILLDNRDLFEQLTADLMEREVVSAEEFQMMLVENNSKVIDYKLIGEERNREKLPFQQLPKTY